MCQQSLWHRQRMTFTVFFFFLFCFHFYLFILPPHFPFNLCRHPWAQRTFQTQSFISKKATLQKLNIHAWILHMYVCVFQMTGASDLCDVSFLKYLLCCWNHCFFLSLGASIVLSVQLKQTGQTPAALRRRPLVNKTVSKHSLQLSPSTAHFIDCTPVWRSHIHLFGLKTTSMPHFHFLHASLHMPLRCTGLRRHLQTSLIPFVTKTTRQKESN